MDKEELSGEKQANIYLWVVEKNRPLASQNHNALSSKELENMRLLSLRLMSWLHVQLLVPALSRMRLDIIIIQSYGLVSGSWHHSPWSCTCSI